MKLPPRQLQTHRKLLAHDQPELRAAMFGPRARWRGVVRAHLRWGESYVFSCGQGFYSFRFNEPARHDWQAPPEVTVPP